MGWLSKLFDRAAPAPAPAPAPTAPASAPVSSAAAGEALAHLDRGRALLQQGQFAAARDSLWQAIALGAPGGDAHGLLGLANEQLNEPKPALEAYQRALERAPTLVDALAGQARTLQALDRDEEAVQAARAWARQADADWAPHFIEAQSLQALGRDADALPALDRALQRAPGQHFALRALGNSLFRLGRYEEAAAAYEQAGRHAPGWADPWANRAAALDRLHRYDEALASADAALARDPKHRHALYLRGVVLISLHREAEAMETFARVRAAYPGDAKAEWDHAFGLLLAGRMAEGWPAFEARWRTTDVGAALKRHPFREPPWTGQPLQGRTLLLYPEQGYGDFIQFARFIPQLEEAGARVLVWVPPPLAALIATASPRCTVASRLEDLPPFDYQCPIMSVTLGLGTTLETLPAQVPYLAADPALRRVWAGRLGAKRGLRVGIAWAGNPAQKNDHNRSIPLEQFAQLAVPGCEFVSLLNNVPPRDEEALRGWPGLRHFGADMKTFADAAALAAEMDLVISVCTSSAHLAGALGLPAWVLLCHRADWRWLLRREDSPWYPTARLFRQDGDCDWTPVLARVREELERRVAAA